MDRINGGFIVKARLPPLLTLMLIGVALAGCAGTNPHNPTRVSCADVMKQDAAKQAAPVSYSDQSLNC